MNYYIADCHFGHNNILHFDHRPFEDVQQMEEVMCKLWNMTVQKDDTVYILGDFCWGKADEWLRLVQKLNGLKVLIEGNHDSKNYPQALQDTFADIKPYKEIIVDIGQDNCRRKVILCHYPLPFYKHSGIQNFYTLCGHIHNTIENNYLEKWTKELRAGNNSTFQPLEQIYNVGCMMPWSGYVPRTLDEIISRWDQFHV